MQPNNSHRGDLRKVDKELSEMSNYYVIEEINQKQNDEEKDNK